MLMICVILARPRTSVGCSARPKSFVNVADDCSGFEELETVMLEGWYFAERVARYLPPRRATRGKNIDRHKVVIDGFLLECETHTPHIDAVRRSKTVGFLD